MNDEEQGADGNEYDPFAHVPERISPLTASGLAWLDEQLDRENKQTLRSLPIERQTTVLARLVETGAVGLRPEVVSEVLDTLSDDSEREPIHEREQDQSQEADR